MTRTAVIGLDVGTTTVKAVVVRGDDFEIISGSTSSPLSMETDDSGRAEQSPSQLLDCVAEAISGALVEVPDGVDVVGLGVASQSGSVVALDQSAQPVGPMITWMDSRSAALVDGWLGTETNDMIRTVSGWNPGPGLGLSTLAWLDTTHPRFRDVAAWVGADTLVTAFLTGQITTNHSNAAAMQLVDMASGEWSSDLCRIAGVAPDLLPRLNRSGDIIASINSPAASLCGLPLNMPVLAGGHDQTCAALALDVIEPGHVLLGSGTAWVVTAVAEADAYDSIPSRFNVSPHVVTDRITASEYLGGLGAEYETWVADTYRSANHQSPERAALFQLVEDDISNSNPRGRMAMTIMRRSAGRVRDSLDQLADSGTDPARITLIGGATASSVWPDIIAEVTGLAVTIPAESSWPAIGAARLAADGLNRSSNIESQSGRRAQETNP